MRKTLSKCISFVLLFGLLPSNSAFAVGPGYTYENAVFLSAAYVRYPNYINCVANSSPNPPCNGTASQKSPLDEILYKGHHFYGIKYFFPIAADLNANGYIRLDNNREPDQAPAFLSKLKDYEVANNYQYKAFAVINGSTDGADALNLGNYYVRQHIIQEALNFVVDYGGYVSRNPNGTVKRAFDGVLIDIEPSGGVHFNNLKTLMIELRNAFAGSVPGKEIAIAAHKLDPSANPNTANWFWTPSEYHYMSRYVNYVVNMAYDTGMNWLHDTQNDYRDWVRDQTIQSLKAISGYTWNNDANHPSPSNGVRLIMGYPAFPYKNGADGSALHDPYIEDIRYSILGTLDGLTTLENQYLTYLYTTFFKGAAIYAHRTGYPYWDPTLNRDQSFSRFDIEWWQFGHYWLGSF